MEKQISGPTNIFQIKKDEFEIILFTDYHKINTLLCKGKTFTIQHAF